MAITEHYSILFDMSMMWDPKLLAQGRTKVGFFRDKPTRFGIIPRFGKGDTIRWFEASPCYMYHTVNAWEQGDEIVLLGCKIVNPLAGDVNNPRRTSRPRALDSSARYGRHVAVRECPAVIVAVVGNQLEVAGSAVRRTTDWYTRSASYWRRRP